MQSVKVEIEVGKELKDVIDFVLAIVVHLRQKKSAQELAELVPLALEAFKGFDKVGDEVKGVLLADNAAYISKEIIRALNTPA